MWQRPEFWRTTGHLPCFHLQFAYDNCGSPREADLRFFSLPNNPVSRGACAARYALVFSTPSHAAIANKFTRTGCAAGNPVGMQSPIRM
jgi:hypothetical protein